MIVKPSVPLYRPDLHKHFYPFIISHIILIPKRWLFILLAIIESSDRLVPAGGTPLIIIPYIRVQFPVFPHKTVKRV